MPSAVPYTPRVFVPDRFDPRSRLGDYARENGRDVAEAMRANGALSAQLWSGIGQNVSGTLRDIAMYPEQQRAAQMLALKQQRDEEAYRQEAQAKQEAAAEAQRYQSLKQQYPDAIPNEIVLKAFHPELAKKIIDTQNEAYGTSRADMQAAEKRGNERAKAIQYGPMSEMDVDTVLQSPERAGDVRYAFGPGMANGPELQPTPEQQRGIQTQKDIEAIGGKIGPNGQVVMPPKPAAPGAPRPAMVNGKRTFVRFGPDGSATDLAGRPVNPDPIAPQGAQPAVASSDVKESIAGMKDGTIPPILPGRASKDYTALMAEAHRQGYDLASAATDWVATQKHIATLNGAQQTRLNQSVNALPEMLDSVDALASQWKAGRFPMLNKANLALAKNGAYGKQAASIATRLESQIADVVADLGNVYMGGNSPTDHALELAGKSLNTNWDEAVLRDSVNNARKNVRIRQNSIRNTGVQGASENNPYAPKPPNVDEEWGRDANGKLVKKGGQ